MKNLFNIEKSVFPGRQYVGYSADGRSWRISGAFGNWTAIANVTSQGEMKAFYGADTLAYLSNQLSSVGVEK